MRQELKKTFVSLHSPAMCLDRLENRIQRAGERLEDYVFDKLRLCHQANENMSDHDRILYVIRGLIPDLIKPAMSIYDRARTSMSWNEFFTQLQRKEATHKMVLRRRRQVDSQDESHMVFFASEAAAPAPAPPETDDIKQLMAQMKELLVHVKDGSKTSGATPTSDGNQRRGNFEFRDGKPVCNYCHKLGHIQRECRQRERARERAPQVNDSNRPQPFSQPTPNSQVASNNSTDRYHGQRRVSSSDQKN